MEIDPEVLAKMHGLLDAARIQSAGLADTLNRIDEVLNGLNYDPSCEQCKHPKNKGLHTCGKENK